MRTTELGVTITDAAVDEKQTTIFCTPVACDPRCPDCGWQGRYRDTVTRPLTDLPVAGYPLVLRVAVPRYRCDTVDCGRAVFNQDLGKLAYPRSSTTRRCARYVLRRLMIDRTTISAIAAELGVSWHTVSSIAMRTTAELVAAAQRPRIPKPHPLPNPLTPPQRRTPRTRQCTLNYEAPAIRALFAHINAAPVPDRRDVGTPSRTARRDATTTAGSGPG